MYYFGNVRLVHVNQWNRRKNPKIDNCFYRILIYDSDGIINQWRNEGLFVNGARKLIISLGEKLKSLLDELKPYMWNEKCGSF